MWKFLKKKKKRNEFPRLDDKMQKSDIDAHKKRQWTRRWLGVTSDEYVQDDGGYGGGVLTVKGKEVRLGRWEVQKWEVQRWGAKVRDMGDEGEGNEVLSVRCEG